MRIVEQRIIMEIVVKQVMMKIAKTCIRYGSMEPKMAKRVYVAVIWSRQ